MADRRDDDVLDTAELLISELVTNALLHARTELTVHVDDRSGVLRFAVDDESEEAPHMGRPRAGDTGGRGLPLVETLASRWGWEALPHGKRVWFEV